MTALFLPKKNDFTEFSMIFRDEMYHDVPSDHTKEWVSHVRHLKGGKHFEVVQKLRRPLHFRCV